MKRLFNKLREVLGSAFGLILLIGPIIGSIIYVLYLISSFVYDQFSEETTLLDQATELIEQEEYAEAIPVLNQLIGLYPENLNAYSLRASTYYHLNQYDSSLSNLDYLIYRSASLSLYIFRGTVRLIVEDNKGSIRDCNKAIEIDPNSGEAYQYRGLAAYKSGDQESACQDWAKANELGMSKVQQLIALYCE